MCGDLRISGRVKWRVKMGSSGFLYSFDWQDDGSEPKISTREINGDLAEHSCIGRSQGVHYIYHEGRWYDSKTCEIVEEDDE